MRTEERICIIPEGQFNSLASSISRIESNQAQFITASNREYLYTDEEFCKILKVSKKTAQIWRHKGAISFVQIGSVVRYRKADIMEFCERFSIKTNLNVVEAIAA